MLPLYQKTVLLEDGELYPLFIYDVEGYPWQLQGYVGDPTIFDSPPIATATGDDEDEIIQELTVLAGIVGILGMPNA